MRISFSWILDAKRKQRADQQRRVFALYTANMQASTAAAERRLLMPYGMRKPLSENILLQQISVLLSVFFRNPEKFHSLIGGYVHAGHQFLDGGCHSFSLYSVKIIAVTSASCLIR